MRGVVLSVHDGDGGFLGPLSGRDADQLRPFGGDDLVRLARRDRGVGLDVAAADELIGDLRQLKLSTMSQTLDDHLRLAQSKSLNYLEFLKGLTTEELRGREASAYRRRLKSARFPITKTPEDFDFLFQPSLTPERILQLKDCRWVANASFSRGKAEPEKVIWP